MICDSCGHNRKCYGYHIPKIDKILWSKFYMLCDECALEIAELLKKFLR